MVDIRKAPQPLSRPRAVASPPWTFIALAFVALIVILSFGLWMR